VDRVGHPGSVDVVTLTRRLVDIDSTTGRENAAGRWLVEYLLQAGFHVREQPVANGRVNILATAGSTRPQVVLSTHYDCVPDFFPSRIENGRIYGRGACDAKGIAAAQIAAAHALHRDGEHRVGLLFVVGEERGSDGARKAAERPGNSRYLVNGEPTDLRLGLATRGVVRVRLVASGRAAHSSFPELGESAIDKLIDALVMLRTMRFASDPMLGTTHYTVGVISGGLAANVVSPTAEAELMFRTVGEHEEIRSALSRLAPLVRVEPVAEVPMVRLTTVPGFETAVFPFSTDIPFLSGWGEPLLFGPGSIHVAHTTEEFIDIAELHSAVDAYGSIVRELLSRV